MGRRPGMTAARPARGAALYRFAPALVFVAALAIRLAYLAQVRGTPITDLLLIDSATYDRFARLIQSGTFRGEDVYAVNPLYPYCLAGLYALGKGSLLFALAAQSGLDAATCALTAWIGARLFGPRVGLLAGLGAAVSGSLVFYAGALLTPTLQTALGMGAIAALVAWQGGARARWAALAGLLLGLCALTRGNAILMLPLAWPCFGGGRARGGGAFALFTACALLPLIAVTVRNFAVSGQWVPGAANFAAFYIGHNDAANGLFVAPRWATSGEFQAEVWGVRDALARELGRPLTLADSARWLFAEGWRWALAHPAGELTLAWTKLRCFWNALDAPTNLSIHFARAWSPLLRVLPAGFAWYAPLGLLGAWWSRDRWRERWALYAWLLVTLLTSLLFFVSAEYRLPALPVLALFGAQAIVVGAQALFAKGARDPRRVVFALVALPLLVVFCAFPPAVLTAQTALAPDYAKFGTLYARRGDLAQACAMFERATVLAPAYRPGWQGLASVRDRMGDAAGALDAAQHASGLSGEGVPGRDGPDALADSGLAAAARFQQGDVAGALAAFERLEAEARAAGDTALALSLLNNVGLCQYRLGAYAPAAIAFERVLAARPNSVKAHYNLGRVRAAQGRAADARAQFEAALVLDPQAPGVRAELAKLPAAR
jgi:tetratricopeptide (TPR) repeat protein